ncbi:MAG: LD-carboxypeptidase, partial [Alphaproteobacteria bacterium]|nr:LD-carboxypeptidase [Alphaproteobacteria bacterium]
MKPPALKPGDTIGVMAPSSYVERKDIEKAKELMEAKGFKVFIHPQTYERLNQSAGSDLQKTLAFQGLWQRKDINAIWAAGGGNRALHFLDSINFKALQKKPKIFIGFSDVTALVNGIYAHTGIATFHGPVFKNLPNYGEMDHLLELLAGEKSTYPLKGAKTIRKGKAQGKLVGGNLSLFQYLPNTLPGKFWKNAILFLEDCGDELSRFDRMLLHLRRTKVLREISGLVLGEFLDVQDTGRPYGFSLIDILKEHTEGLDIPVIIDAPFGHGGQLYTFPV